MVQNNLRYENNISLLTFLISSQAIFNPIYTGGNKLLITILTSLIGGIFVIVSKHLILKPKSKLRINSFINKGMGTICFVLFSLISGVLLYEYTGTISKFSDFYSNRTYKSILILAIILICLYICNTGLKTILRICVPVLITISIYYISMFLGILSTGQSIIPDKIDFSLNSYDLTVLFKSTVFLFADVCILFFVFKKNENFINYKISITKTIAVYIGILLLNVTRNCLILGTNLISEIKYPDIAIIKLIPKFELTEIVILVVGMAIILKCSVLFVAGISISENKNKGLSMVFQLFLTFLFYILCDTLANTQNIFLSTSFYILMLITICITVLYSIFDTNKL